MMYQNVPVPAAVDKVGGGYIGAQQAPQGHALGVEMVRRFGLKSGDLAIVILASNDVIRNAREEGTAKALEEGGVKVVRLASDPTGRPIRTSPFPSSPRPCRPIRRPRRSSIPAARCSATRPPT